MHKQTNNQPGGSSKITNLLSASISPTGAGAVVTTVAEIAEPSATAAAVWLVVVVAGVVTGVVAVAGVGVVAVQGPVVGGRVAAAVAATAVAVGSTVAGAGAGAVAVAVAVATAAAAAGAAVEAATEAGAEGLKMTVDSEGMAIAGGKELGTVPPPRDSRQPISGIFSLFLTVFFDLFCVVNYQGKRE
jgi:hypothetical protein